MEKTMNKNTIRLYGVSLQAIITLAIIGIGAMILYFTYTRTTVINSLDSYAASGQTDAVLIGDYAACLKLQTPILPLQSTECADFLEEKYGPAVWYRIDSVWKSLGN